MRPVSYIAPPAFVVLWATGFIGAVYGLPYAEPMTFLSIRFFFAAVGVALVAALIGRRWPRRGEVWPLAVAGLLVHAGYLGGMFMGMSLGVEAGVAALVGGLQPVLSAIIAGWLLGERVTARQWLGLALGLAGVILVISDKLAAGIGDLWGAAACGFGLICMSFGAIWQKKYCSDAPFLSGAAVQYAVSALAIGAVALLFESNVVQWTADFVFAVAWLVLALSVGAVSALYYLLRHGAAAKVASLFFLVPPVAALMGWTMYDETLSLTAVFGMAVAVAGVALATRG